MSIVPVPHRQTTSTRLQEDAGRPESGQREGPGAADDTVEVNSDTLDSLRGALAGVLAGQGSTPPPLSSQTSQNVVLAERRSTSIRHRSFRQAGAGDTRRSTAEADAVPISYATLEAKRRHTKGLGGLMESTPNEVPGRGRTPGHPRQRSLAKRRDQEQDDDLAAGAIDSLLWWRADPMCKPLRTCLESARRGRATLASSSSMKPLAACARTSARAFGRALARLWTSGAGREREAAELGCGLDTANAARIRGLLLHLEWAVVTDPCTTARGLLSAQDFVAEARGSSLTLSPKAALGVQSLSLSRDLQATSPPAVHHLEPGTCSSSLPQRSNSPQRRLVALWDKLESTHGSLSQAFCAMDISGRGVVSFGDFHAHLVRLRLCQVDAEGSRRGMELFKLLDVDGDDLLSPQDCVQAFAAAVRIEFAREAALEDHRNDAAARAALGLSPERRRPLALTGDQQSRLVSFQRYLSARHGSLSAGLRAMDPEGSGYVLRGAFLRAMLQDGYCTSMQEGVELFQLIDVDGTGALPLARLALWEEESSPGWIRCLPGGSGPRQPSPERGDQLVPARKAAEDWSPWTTSPTSPSGLFSEPGRLDHEEGPPPLKRKWAAPAREASPAHERLHAAKLGHLRAPDRLQCAYEQLEGKARIAQAKAEAAARRAQEAAAAAEAAAASAVDPNVLEAHVDMTDLSPVRPPSIVKDGRALIPHHGPPQSSSPSLKSASPHRGREASPANSLGVTDPFRFRRGDASPPKASGIQRRQRSREASAPVRVESSGSPHCRSGSPERARTQSPVIGEAPLQETIFPRAHRAASPMRDPDKDINLFGRPLRHVHGSRAREGSRTRAASPVRFNEQVREANPFRTPSPPGVPERMGMIPCSKVPQLYSSGASRERPAARTPSRVPQERPEGQPRARTPSRTSQGKADGPRAQRSQERLTGPQRAQSVSRAPPPDTQATGTASGSSPQPSQAPKTAIHLRAAAMAAMLHARTPAAVPKAKAAATMQPARLMAGKKGSQAAITGSSAALASPENGESSAQARLRKRREKKNEGNTSMDGGTQEWQPPSQTSPPVAQDAPGAGVSSPVTEPAASEAVPPTRTSRLGSQLQQRSKSPVQDSGAGMFTSSSKRLDAAEELDAAAEGPTGRNQSAGRKRRDEMRARKLQGGAAAFT